MIFLILTLIISSIVFLFADVMRCFEWVMKGVWSVLEKLNAALQMAFFCAKNPRFAVKIAWSLGSKVILPLITRALGREQGEKPGRARVKFEQRVEDLSSPGACRITNICLLDNDGRSVITEIALDLDGTTTLGEAISALTSQEANFGEDLVLLVTYYTRGQAYRKALSKECLEMTLDDMLLEGTERRANAAGEELASIIQQEIESAPLPLNRLLTVDFFDADGALLKNLPDGIEDVVYSLMGPIGLLSSSCTPRLTQSGQSLKSALLFTVRTPEAEKIKEMKNIQKMEITGTLLDQKVCL